MEANYNVCYAAGPKYITSQPFTPGYANVTYGSISHGTTALLTDLRLSSASGFVYKSVNLSLNNFAEVD